MAVIDTGEKSEKIEGEKKPRKKKKSWIKQMSCNYNSLGMDVVGKHLLV